MTQVSVRKAVLERQAGWALRTGRQASPSGYLDTVRANLYQPLSAAALAGFEAGSGAELSDAAGRPAKMKALHSSAALAVNVFDYWAVRDAGPLALAMGLDGTDAIRALTFERQYPTGLPGTPPNLDVVLSLASGFTVAIESKFTEWMTPAPARTGAFRPAYFPASGPLWAGRGLHGCQRLAGAIAAGDERFRWLDAPQLLKHALGLATRTAGRFSLHYLYYDTGGPKGAAHRAEIGRFSSLAGEETRFVAGSYQDLFRSIRAHAAGADQDYLDYLADRYF